tara:strand:+ start:367 stop:4662 length:4296 start_codon:yes stop_codon:yes gene_type:complete
MAKFKGFTNQQTHQLLSELGYDGPVDKEMMDAFVAATPSAASMLGRYNEMARDRIEGRPMSMGFQGGGKIVKPSSRELIEAISGKSLKETQADGSYAALSKQASDLLYGVVGSNQDTRNWNAIMASDNIVAAAQQATGQMYASNAPDPNITSKSTTDSEKLGTKNTQGETIEYFNVGQTFNKPSIVETNIGGAKGFAIVDANGQILRNLPTLEQAQKAGVNFGVGADASATNLLATTTGTGTTGTGITSELPDEITTTDDDLKQITEGSATQPDFTGTPFDTTTATDLGLRTDLTTAQPQTQQTDVTIPKFAAGQGQTQLDQAQQAYADAQKTLTDAQQAFNKLTDPSDLYTDPDAAIEAAFQTDFNEGTEGRNRRIADDKAWAKTTVSEMTNVVDPKDYKLGTFVHTNGKTYIQLEYPDGTIVKTFHNNNSYAIGRANILAAATIASRNIVSEEEKTRLTNEYDAAKLNLENAQSLIETTYGDLKSAEERMKVTDIPTVAESLAQTISSPQTLVTKQDVSLLKVQNGQLIDKGTGEVASIDDIIAAQATLADAVNSPSVKAVRGYLARMSPDEINIKYPPAPIGTPEEDLVEYVARQQAQVAQDATDAAAAIYTAYMSQAKVKTALEEFAAKTGTLSDDAIAKAATMPPEELAQLDLDPKTLEEIREVQKITRDIQEGELPDPATFDEIVQAPDQQITEPVEEVDAAKFATDTPIATPQVDYTLPPTQSATAEATRVENAAEFSEIANAQQKQTEFVPDITAEQATVVDANEIVDVNNILNTEEIVVTGQTLSGLNEAATLKAQTATFTQQLEAQFTKGEVSPQSTVSFQLEKLMDSFNDGTPAWAAGALRKVNEVMNARGLGASSMAGAAMIQAAMESAIPIAQADASIFQAIDMENIRNKQAVALANAAAAQRFELENLNNQQAAAIQNSTNNANLQLTNLSNTQEAVLAQAQLRAGLRNQNLNVSQNVALANAARFAEVNNLNLTNRQQASILESTQALEVDLTNLSNAQQTALSNLQVKASMMGQVLSNEQQVAVLTSTQAFETEMQNATNKQQAFIQDAVAAAAMQGRVLDNRQQTSLFNVSNQIQEREAELSNEQQVRLFNMTNKLNIDVENLSNRQQTALANAQIEAAMRGQELTNEQQVNVIRADRIAEIANLQFSADQTRVLRNSELVQTFDITNITNEQAKLLADAAALTQVDVTNLSNEQQAAQQKANAFLSLDLSNIDKLQQMELFKAQESIQSIFSDQGAANAAAQFNSSSLNQTRQFMMNQDSQIDMFNNAQMNAMNQFNTGELNSISKFNQELENQRDMFNAQNQLVVAQANAQWRQQIATINNQNINDANMRAAAVANNLTAQGIAELWQQERDLMNYAWTTSEKQADREFELVKAKINNDAAGDAAFSAATGTFLSAVVGAVGEAGGIGSFFS